MADYTLIIDSGIFDLHLGIEYLTDESGNHITDESGNPILLETSINGVELYAGRLITISSGAITLTGSDVRLASVGYLVVESGSLSLSGSLVGLYATRLLSVGSGAIVLSGSSVDLLIPSSPVVMPIGSGSIVLAGSALTFRILKVPYLMNIAYDTYTWKQVGRNSIHIHKVKQLKSYDLNNYVQ